MPAAVTSVAADSANLAPAIRNSCTPSLLRHPATSALLLALNPVSNPALLPTPPIPPMQLGLLPTPSPATRLLLRPPPVASPVVRQPMRLPSRLIQPPWSLTLSATFPRGSPGRLLCQQCPSPTLAIIDRQPSAPLSVDRRVKQVARQTASALSTVDASPATASVSPSPTHSGHIRPAHSVADYNRRDFSRSAAPGSVFNFHVTY